MGIIEETAVKAKGAFDVVAKKTGEVWTIQKLKFNVASENSQLSKDYETLGRLYFDAIAEEDELPEDVAALKAAIIEKKAKIAEYEAEIDAQKKVAVCPECGAKNASDDAYCSKCGKQL